jgi:exonuclease III
VTATTLPLWRAALDEAGLPHVRSSIDHGAPTRRESGRRGLGVLVAAREPLEPLPAPEDVPWPERVLVVGVGGIELVNLHSPISPAPDLAKVRTHEAVHAYLSRPDSKPRLLCGDLNTPRREHADGTVLTFAHNSNGTLRPERGERWDRAEQSLVRGLADAGFRDAFRDLHGFERRDRSWTWPNGGGYRLDHLIVSGGVDVVACEYAHDWRESGLSDHSGLVADIRRRPL